jgi:hypothetical protein
MRHDVIIGSQVNICSITALTSCRIWHKQEHSRDASLWTQKCLPSAKLLIHSGFIMIIGEPLVWRPWSLVGNIAFLTIELMRLCLHANQTLGRNLRTDALENNSAYGGWWQQWDSWLSPGQLLIIIDKSVCFLSSVIHSRYTCYFHLYCWS